MRSASRRAEFAFMYAYMEFSEGDREYMGHRLENFIKSCSFGGLDCHIDDRLTKAAKSEYKI